MLVDDIKKSQLLGISYGEYMALKKDFYSEDEKKALRATVKMAELMKRASEKLRRSEDGGNDERNNVNGKSNNSTVDSSSYNEDRS